MKIILKVQIEGFSICISKGFLENIPEKKNFIGYIRFHEIIWIYVFDFLA